MATGMVLVIVMRHIDLSVGSMLSFVAVIDRRPAGLRFAAELLGSRPSRHLDHCASSSRLALGAAHRRASTASSSPISADPVLHRHARRPLGLARRRLVGDASGANDRAAWTATSSSSAAGRQARSARPGAGCLARSSVAPSVHRHASHGAPAAQTLQVSAAADLGGVFSRGRRLRADRRRGRHRQCLSVAAGSRAAAMPNVNRDIACCRKAALFIAPRLSPIPVLIADRRRRRHDLHRHAHALRPLRLCDRRQSGSGRACRHQHQAGDR